MFYGVRSGINPGIYTNWSECQEQINGYSGAEYKKFKTYEEAYQFVNGEEVRQDGIYIDGSYSQGVYAYAIIKVDKESHYKAGLVPKEWAMSSNIGAELYAAYLASQIESDLPVYYDYLGIHDFLTGEWKDRIPVAKLYKQMVDPAFVSRLHKVQAHTNVFYNDLVDKLAKTTAKIRVESEGIIDEHGRTFPVRDGFKF